MAKLNNATQVLFASLILNGKASIDDVPTKLKDGVQAELDFFNGIEMVFDTEKQAEAKTTTADKPAAVSSDAPAPSTPVIAKSDNSEDTDKVVSDINNAVKDAK